MKAKKAADRVAAERQARRARADQVWRDHGGRPQGVILAAHFLDEADFSWMADNLLFIRPDRLFEVGAIVAADALMQQVPAAWDCLVIPGNVDAQVADERYSAWSESRQPYEWEPAESDLIP